MIANHTAEAGIPPQRPDLLLALAEVAVAVIVALTAFLIAMTGPAFDGSERTARQPRPRAETARNRPPEASTGIGLSPCST